MKVDTSAKHTYELTRTILGKKQIETSEITPEAWLRVLQDIFCHWHMKDAEFLFQPIADFTDGRAPFVEVAIPRGTIEFEKGLAVTTHVLLSPIDEKHVEAGPHPLFVRRNLLLIKPAENTLPKWALWSISSATSKGGGTKKVVQSSVGYVDEGRLLRIFEQHPSCPDFFLNCCTSMMLHAEDLRNQAHKLGMLSQWIGDIRQRVRRR